MPTPTNDPVTDQDTIISSISKLAYLSEKNKNDIDGIVTGNTNRLKIEALEADVQTLQSDVLEVSNEIDSVVASVQVVDTDLQTYKQEVDTNLALKLEASDLQDYATKADLEGISVGEVDLSNYATKEDLESITIDTTSLEKIASKALTIDSTTIADETNYPTVKAVSDYVAEEISKIPTSGEGGIGGIEVIEIDSNILQQENSSPFYSFVLGPSTNSTWSNSTYLVTNTEGTNGLAGNLRITDKDFFKFGIPENNKENYFAFLPVQSTSIQNITNVDDVNYPTLILSATDDVMGNKRVSVSFMKESFYNRFEICSYTWQPWNSPSPSVCMYFDTDRLYFMTDEGFSSKALGYIDKFDIGDEYGYLNPVNNYYDYLDSSISSSYLSAKSFRWLGLPTKSIKKPNDAEFLKFYKVTGESFPNWNKISVGIETRIDEGDFVVFLDDNPENMVVYKNTPYDISKETQSQILDGNYKPVNSVAVSQYVKNTINSLQNSLKQETYIANKPFGNYSPSLHSNGSLSWNPLSANQEGLILVPAATFNPVNHSFRYGKLVEVSESYTTFTVQAFSGSFSIWLGSVQVEVFSSTRYRINGGTTRSYNQQLAFLVRRNANNTYEVIVATSVDVSGIYPSTTGSWDGSINFHITPSYDTDIRLNLSDTLQTSFSVAAFNGLTKIRHTDTSYKPWLAKVGDIVTVNVNNCIIDDEVYNNGDVLTVASVDRMNLTNRYSIVKKKITTTRNWTPHTFGAGSLGQVLTGIPQSDFLLEFANYDGYAWVRGKFKCTVRALNGQSLFRIDSPLFKCSSDYTPARLGTIELNYGSDIGVGNQLVSYVTDTSHDLVFKNDWYASHTDWVYINPTPIGKIAV